MRFNPPGDFPRKNLQISKHDNIPVEDVRGHEEDLSLDKNGFTVIKLETSLSKEDFDHRETIISQYLPEVADRLKQCLGASRIQVHDFLVVLSLFRRRSRADG